jgi:Aerotolerance regulator N-terminal/von Willebrand factor type A domain
MDSPMIAQLGFSNWLMLGWTAAAAVPVAIHLLRRHRRKSIPWAAMQLLQKVIDQQSKRSRLQQLILLMVRVLVLLLLALALARPFWTDPSQAMGQIASRPSKFWIVVMDTSYSMGYRAGGQSRMDRAKQQASQLVSSCQQGDVFALVALDDPARPIIGTATFDSQSTLAEIQRLSESACGCNLAAAVAIASDIAADCKSNSNLPQDIELVIYSDLGNDAWQSAIEGPVAKSLARLRQLANITVESLADNAPINTAIESVIPTTNRPVVGNPLGVEVTLASYGAAIKSLPVQLELDDQVVASQTIDIEAGQKKQVRFQVAIQSAGFRVLSVMIPSDNLPIDNRYDVIIEATQGNRVMIVDSRSLRTNPWRLALRSVNALPTVDDSNLRVVPEISWATVPLKDWNVLVFNDVAITEAAQVNRLASYVDAGGSVVFAWGPNSAGSNLRTSLGTTTEPLSQLLGFEFRSISESGDWSVDPIDYRSPIVAPFAGFPNSGLLTMPIFRYWQIEKLSADAVTDLALTTGDPLVVRKRLGRGWVVSFLSAPEDGQNSSSDESWNAITTWPSFLPLAQQLVQTISESDAQSNNRTAGQTISERLPAFSQATAIMLQRPDQTELRIACAQSDRAGRSEWSYSGTDARGLYRVTEPTEAQRLFAININPEQSSLQSIDLQSIRPLLGVSNVATTASRGDAESAQNSDWLARIFLSLLGSLLVIEMLLAWLIGKRIE